ERGVERRRLTRAGRTGDEQNAVRLVDELVHERLRARIHAERVELQAAGLLVEQTQYDALAMACRNRRDAHVDRTARDAQRDASVLRQALLGDVELRHDLDARDDERGDGALRLQYLAKHAVNAKPDDETVFERLDMDIGRIVLYGLRQDGVDQLDDRRLIVAFEQIGGLGQVLGEMREVGTVFHSADHLHRHVAAAFVMLAEQLIERVAVDATQLQR